MAMPDPDQIPEAIWSKMNISREAFKELQARMIEREKTAPAVGSLAPDFELERLSVEGDRMGQQLRLSDHYDRQGPWVVFTIGLTDALQRKEIVTDALARNSGWIEDAE